MLWYMSISMEVRSEQDRPVVVKRADGVDIGRLRAEGARLRAASHPGVVQLLSSAPSADGWELRTVHAGRALDVARPSEVGHVASLAAGLAATLADLHAVGIVHGRIEPSHVLIGVHGRPVLCGFGADEAAPRAEPADDVAGVGAVLTSLLGTEGDVEPIPERRWRHRRGWNGWERRALLTLADQACAEPATRRPTARRLAAAITEAVPVAALPDVDVSGPDEARAAVAQPVDPLDALRASAPPPIDRWSSRKNPTVFVVVAIVVFVAAFVVPSLRSGGDTRTPSIGASQRSTRTPTSPASSIAAPPSVARPTAPASTEPTTCGPVIGVDLDRDGCREAVTVDGQIVTVGDTRFQVGERGDQVAVRDWNCDGEATPAVLRPSTGEVFVFTRWDPEADLVVPPVATVVGGMELVVASASRPCSGLSVRTADSVVDILRAPA